MPSTHLGSCLGCGRSVFGPPGNSFGGLQPHQCGCSCLSEWKSPLTTASFLIGMSTGKGMPAYDLVCRKIHVLDTDILLFSLRRGTENVVVGHLEM
jgi:hypothetical protein